MKMKQVWSSPKTSFEQFVPQNYIAACGDSGTVYKFTCDAPGGPLYYFPDKTANMDSNDLIGKKGTYLGSYHPCSKKHEAESNSGFYWGYVDKSHGSSWSDYESANQKLDADELVIVWRGNKGGEGHATAALNMNDWETAKS